MKRLYTLLLIMLSTWSITNAQPYENSWINYSQTYYKIKVWQEGIYRLKTNELLFSGIPVSSIDNRNIQLFRNGVEQYVYVYDQNGDHTLNGNDYIEFYGERNDGRLDTRMYKDTTWQPNVNYSLFTDTSVYFLTYNNSLLNKRLTVVIDTTYTGYTASNYFIRDSYREDATRYNEGYQNPDIDYTETEGWMDLAFYTGAPQPKTINTQNIYTGAGAPNIDINTTVAGANNNPHNINITFPGTNFSDSYVGYKMRRYPFSISPIVFTSSSTVFNYSATTIGQFPDYNSFVNLSVKYPHTYNLENASSFKLFVPDDAQGKTYMQITNFNMTGSTEAILYDVTNHKRIVVTQAGSTLSALVLNDGQTNPKTCYLAASSQITNISTNYIGNFNYVTSNQGLFNNFATPKDSAYIIITNRALWNAALAYKAYRDITTNNKVVLVDVDELFDQFSYGVREHPLAIKNFTKYILDTWSSVHPPQALFLLGKSIRASDSRLIPTNFANNLVPSYGNPPSDVLLTSGINGSIYDPKIPVGRLSAKTPADVTNYLEKIQAYEAAQAQEPVPGWMKEVLHFGGGASVPEQDEIKNDLNNFKAIIEDTLFGGHVTSYFKTSTQPIVIDQSAALQAKIDSGVSIMTFFGHASGSGFDQSTDLPENYGNHDKLPIIIANSCFAGDIHTSIQSISERFVTLPEIGAIGFIASVGEGQIYYLNIYSGFLYKNISFNNYGETIGKILQHTVLQVQDTNFYGTKIVCQEMSLQGDPGIKINSWKKPDYLMTQSNIYFTPSTITTNLDTFNVHVIVRNLAKAVPDSFNVVVTRTYPNGTDSVYTTRIAHCYYADSLQLTMHVNGFSSSGINKFKVEVDLPTSEVDEIDNTFNNSATATLFITSNDLVPVFPAKFAIVPYNTIALKASTSDPLAGMKTYRFEMDTSYQAFGEPPVPSPLFRFTTITDSGGVITWNNNIQLLDSTVYYWRVANDSIQNDPVTYKWQESSFIHIPNRTGWSQKHFYQFKDDGYTNVIPDSINRKFDFVHNNKTLDVNLYGSPVTNSQAFATGYWLNGTNQDYTSCGPTAAVMVVVIDSTSLEPWTTACHDFGQNNLYTVYNGDCVNPVGMNECNPGRLRTDKYFIYRYSDPLIFPNLGPMLNAIPSGDYVLVYSWYTNPYSTNPTFLNAMNSVGFQTSFLNDNAPYIFFMKKGFPATEQHLVGQLATDSLHYSHVLSSVWDRGTIASDLIGPSSQWHELHWREHALETGITKDTTALNIYGITAAGHIDTLRYGMQTSSSDTTLSWISATQYPYLRLEAYVKDDSLRTPPQLDKWQVYYEEVPECAVNANRNFSFHASPMAEGDTLRMSIAIDNIANKPMDSLAVDFYMYDNNRIRHNLKSLKLDSLRVNQSLLANVELDTTFGLSGNNSLWVEANPQGVNHQPEQFHFNNIAEMKFKINKDAINPILDVTFDAIHILDGDIVSGKPDITIQLHDENKFLALNDTADFRVYLKTPSSNTEQRIYFSQQYFGGSLRFTPAVLPKNSCKIDWNPILAEDGIYSLEVEATDASRNESGKYMYKISFEVINRSTITEVLNYPNPFSTSTRFVFTLTGNEIPGYMKIQIMTVTGKIIREIEQNELGNIHIGRNITDYAWNGKDEFGDQIANGLYLYRVISKINGSDIEHRNTEADKYFKKGWGKMYLMR